MGGKGEPSSTTSNPPSDVGVGGIFDGVEVISVVKVVPVGLGVGMTGPGLQALSASIPTRIDIPIERIILAWVNIMNTSMGESYS